MKALFHLAVELQDSFQRKHWKFCFIGGIALQRWGEPRVTQDVDITLLTGFGAEAPFIDELLKHYQGRIRDSRGFALANRVLLLKSRQNIGIDIALGGLRFEEETVKRATLYEFLPGLKLKTCSAEDLIVMKSFADRNRDWADVEGIIIRQQHQIDWPYVLKRLAPLCRLKHSPDIISKLKALRERSK